MKDKLTLLLFILLTSCSILYATGIQSSELTHKGIKRAYCYYVPKVASSAKKIPLLFVLHGAGGNGEQISKFTKYKTLADKDTFIIVYPSGWKRYWNDGRDATFESHRMNIDDVDFIDTLITIFQNKYSIDSRRVYATGLSNGGFMCFRLACELSDKITAIAPIISSMPQNAPNTCNAKHPTSVLLINGTADPLCPYNGGHMVIAGKDRGNILSTKQAIEFWATKNNCKTKSDTIWLPHLNPSDNTRLNKVEYTGGDNNTSVVLYTAVGGGHNMPGGKQYLPKFMIGPTNYDMVTEEVVWSFLKQYKL